MPLTPAIIKSFAAYRTDAARSAQERLAPFLKTPENEAELRTILAPLQSCRVLIPGAGIVPGLNVLLQQIETIKPGIQIHLVLFDQDPLVIEYTKQHVIPEFSRIPFRRPLNLTFTYYLTDEFFRSNKEQFDIVYLEHPVVQGLSCSFEPDEYRMLFTRMMNFLKKNVFFICTNYFVVEMQASTNLIKAITPNAELSLQQTGGRRNIFHLEHFAGIQTVLALQPPRRPFSQQEIAQLSMEITQHDNIKKAFICFACIFSMLSPTAWSSLPNGLHFLAQSTISYLQITSPGARYTDLISLFLLFLLQLGMFIIAGGDIRRLVFEE